MLNKLAKQIHANARRKGFYEHEKNIGEILCLIHSEVSEALEADRNKSFYGDINQSNLGLIEKLADPNYFSDDLKSFKSQFELMVKSTFEDELADVFIRTLDLCAFKGIDIENHIKAKMRYNESRPYKHGKSY